MHSIHANGLQDKSERRAAENCRSNSLSRSAIYIGRPTRADGLSGWPPALWASTDERSSLSTTIAPARYPANPRHHGALNASYFREAQELAYCWFVTTPLLSSMVTVWPKLRLASLSTCPLGHCTST